MCRIRHGCSIDSVMDWLLSRKAFLKLLGLLGLAGPAVLATGCGSDGGGGGTPADVTKVEAFKLSRRKQASCRACANHARNKVFDTQAAADANRAHPGCNCRIKVVRIPRDEAAGFFADGPVYDRRSSA